jgi:class 3 adenylate cyclase
MMSEPTYSPIGVPLIPKSGGPISAETTVATVLHAHLRGYGTLVEHLAPAQAASLLGEFFDILRCAVWAAGGQIFHMAEADFMAAFGVGDVRHSQIEEAVAAAVAMQRHFAPIRQGWREQHAIDAGIGIGLHRGEVAIGIFGPPAEASRTLIGDAANVAAALCRRARAGEVLLSAAVHLTRKPVAAEALPATHLPRFHIRGRSAPIDVWCVAVDRSVAARRSRAAH